MCDFPKVTISGRTRPAGSAIFLLCHFQGPPKERRGSKGTTCSFPPSRLVELDYHTVFESVAGFLVLLPKAEMGLTRRGQRAGGLDSIPICTLTHSFCRCCGNPTHIPAALSIHCLGSYPHFAQLVPGSLCSKSLCGHWTPLCPAHGRLKGLELNTHRSSCQPTLTIGGQ